MHRRDIIKITAYVTGASLSAPLVTSLLSGCGPMAESIDGSNEVFSFSMEQSKLITQLTDTILPKTDSPSASEVGVPNLIQHMVGTVYNASDRKEYMDQLKVINTFLEESSKEGFIDQEADHQKKCLQEIENSKSGISDHVKNSYLRFKQQAVAYYLTTEEIGTKFLNYLPVPGTYEACITTEEAGGKAWAL